MTLSSHEHLSDWTDREATAEAMIPLIGSLYRDNGVVTSVYGRPLVNQSAIGILKAHRFLRHVTCTEVSVAQSLSVLQAISAVQPGPASIDVARIVEKFAESGEPDLGAFVQRMLAGIALGAGQDASAGTDVVLYGFGRIGRLLARILIAHEGVGRDLRLRAVVVRRSGDGDLEKRANLLRRDSVHGPFNGSITADPETNTILANGTLIQVIYSDDPGSIDYTAYDIHDAIVVDNTGRWRDRAGLARHLESTGVARVLLTAPGKGDVPNIVFGVNNAEITSDERVLSAASCTTNAITPVLKAINDRYTVTHGHVETVHSFTNDQNLIDNFHHADRRGRAATLNMVITETGAARAVGKALPELAGKLTGNAIRVPTPDVSLAILSLQLGEPVTADEINGYLRDVSLSSPLAKQIDFTTSPEIVSTDLVGSRRAGVVDGTATIANGTTDVVLYVWYDNEFGYSSQVVRVIEAMAGVQPPMFPPLESAAAPADASDIDVLSDPLVHGDRGSR